MSIKIGRGMMFDGEIPSGVSAGPDPYDDRMPAEARAASVQRDSYSGCRHSEIDIDKEQRVVKCQQCGMWLDPIWVLVELVYHYETRIDHRLRDIREFDKKQAAATQRQKDRKANPRPHREATLRENMERAAYNKYQAELLLIRAGKQIKAAKKIQDELNRLGKDGDAR